VDLYFMGTLSTQDYQLRDELLDDLYYLDVKAEVQSGT
jgi:hypothetical protein